MKKIIALFVVAISFTATAQEATVGSSLPPLQVINIINGKSRKTSLESLKGKLVILDFWATWCSPCVAALGEFEKYKKRFGDKLVVLAVSDETESRLKQFMVNRPTSLLISSDTAGSLRPIFPHRTIPHTVLIGIDGKVNAITNAENITPEVLQLALKNVVVNLPLKKDNVNFNIETYFKSDSSLQQVFNMLPPAEGAGTMSRMYPEGIFKDRRITIVNMPMDGLYRMAFNKTFSLVKNEYDTVKRKYADEKKYCLDFWVAAENRGQLLPFFQKKLKEQFVDVEAVLEKRKIKVLVIKADSTAAKKLKASAKSNDRFNAGGSHFEGNGVQVSALASYMEDFGLYNGKVMDETGIAGRYDIFFEWQPEKKESLKAAFANLGLYWEGGEREVEVLVLKKRS
jgi:uncharacterized protein (TIGR03435 family)